MSEYPFKRGFGESAAEFLLKEREVAGFAVDCVSTEALALAGGKKPNPYPVHFAAHAAAKYQIEAFAMAKVPTRLRTRLGVVSRKSRCCMSSRTRPAVDGKGAEAWSENHLSTSRWSCR